LDSFNKVIEMGSILRNEERVLLRNKYLPAIWRKYETLIKRLNMVADPVENFEEEEVWLNETAQLQMVRGMDKEVEKLIKEAGKLQDYITQILTRLES